VALQFVLRDVALKAIAAMPELARELMAPAKAIREIRVLQTSNGSGGGNGAANGSQGPLGVMSPILKTILEAGAAYPLLKEMMSFAESDGGKLTEKAKAMLGDLPEELSAILGKTPGKNGDAAATHAAPAAAAPDMDPDIRVNEVPVEAVAVAAGE
jgi:flotillin